MKKAGLLTAREEVNTYSISRRQISLSSDSCPQEAVFCPQENLCLIINYLRQWNNCLQQVCENDKDRRIEVSFPFLYSYFHLFSANALHSLTIVFFDFFALFQMVDFQPCWF